MGNHNKTVLVVEDNLLNTKLTVDLLELNGFNVLKAADAKSALGCLENNKPDLIVLDIGLPDMDGRLLFQKIRADNRFSDVKIIAVTASVMREEEGQIKSMGFDAFISKPIDTGNFIKEIKRVIEK